jgi:type VI secretion system secreted protein VgrG
MTDFAANVAHHRFEVSTLGPDTFQVLAYTGEETLSQPFQYAIELGSDDGEIAFADVINQPATLTTLRDGTEVPVCGVVVDFREEGPSTGMGRFRYRATLAPRLWRLSLGFQTRIFQDATPEEIVTQVLKDADVPASSFRFDLKASYAPRDYCVQYQETNLAFVSRLLEHEGIQYFFEHADGEDVLVMTDDRSHNPAIADPSTVAFNTRQGTVPGDESVYRFVGHERIVTGAVVLKDYNDRTPETTLEVESRINPDMPGLRYEYGQHFADSEEGRRLARVRNEELECQRRVLHGESDCAALRPGHTFSLTGHYRGDTDGEYLVTSVQHRGAHSAARAEFSDNGTSDEPVYRNTFTCIPAEVPYRPPRTTPIPQVPGVMTARTESIGGDYPFVDEDGRYRLKMDFDRRANTGSGKATPPIRRTQMHTGPNHGMHFGEHADTEMIWACLNGDPDRPLALSSVPNPSQKSPVVAENKAQNVIRTKAGNQLVMDDTVDKARLRLETPDANALELDDEADRIRLQTTNKHAFTLDDKNEHVTLKTTKGHTVVFDDKNEAITIQSAKEHFVRINDKDEVITLSDQANANLFVIDIKNEKIVIKTENGSIDMHAPKGKIDIQAKELNVETTGDTTLKAANITSEAQSDHATKAANVKVDAKMDLQQKGTNIASKASMNHETSGLNVKSQASVQNDVSGAMLNLKASGINTVQGSLVKIN